MTAVLEDALRDAPVVNDDSDELLPPVQQRMVVPQRRYLTSTTPWRAKDIARVGILGTAGVIGLGICVFGASGEVSLRDQIGWILASLLSTGIVVVAGAVSLITSFREVRRGIRELAADKVRVFDLDRVSPAALVLDAFPADAELSGFVTVPGMAHFHRSQCLLVANKSTITASPDQLLPCGVCFSE